MFASQENLAKAIQSQGTVLASGQQAGQSMMLSVDDVARKYGMQQAQLAASVFDATKAYGIKQFGVNLDQYNSDMSAINNLSTSAVVAPNASFMTVKPIKQKAPPKPSMLTPLLSGFSAGVSTWSGVKTALKP